jgi:signal transduction histidine kinase
MRTPLTAIRGFAEYLTENDVSPAQQHELLGLVVTESKRLQNLIENLLSLQRMRSGIGLDSPAPVPIAPLLQDVIEIFRSPIERHRISLDCPTDLPPLFGEAGKIHLAMKNLLGNAVKYAPAGTEIAVGARADSGCALLWVRDQGPGVPAEQQERIFERYYRASCDSKGPVGSGIGLALVREIATVHNGRVWVENSPAGGSTFYLRLPFAR